MKVAAAVIGAKASDSVKPFDDSGTGKHDDVPKDLLWCGPHRCGPFVLMLHGPLQIMFIVMILVAVVMLLVEVFKEENKHVFRWITAVGFIVIAAYLFWIGKGLYVLKWLRREVTSYKRLSGELRGKLEDLKKQNNEYETLNAEQVKANEDLGGEVRSLSASIADIQQQNAERDRLNNEMVQQVQDLKKTERQLETFADQCSGNTAQAQSVIERLERNIQLDTINSVMMFFERSDLTKNGRISSEEEVTLFVHYLHMLWRHLPSFDPEAMKASIMERGGIEMEQVRELVEKTFADPGTLDARDASNSTLP